MVRLRPLSLGLGLTATVLLAGCGGGGGSDTPVFKPLSYTYLTPLRLNVGQIQIEDNVPPPSSPADLGAAAPVPPDQALRRMAQDRLVAAGSSGKAVFTIDQAAITGQDGGALNGTMAVHLDIVSSSGGHAGYTEAHVSRQFVPGSQSDNDGLKSQLYSLTSQMMQDMNVEFEFQLRRTLGDWMVDASGAPVAATVDQQPLTPGNDAGGSPPAPTSVGAPMQLAPPSGMVPPGAVQAPYQEPGAGQAPGAAPMSSPQSGGDPGAAGPSAADPTAGAPMQLSPAPGFLQAPNGVMPVAPPAAASPGNPSATPPGY